MGLFRDGVMALGGAVLATGALIYSPDLGTRIKDSFRTPSQQKQCDASLRDYADAIQQQANYRACPVNRHTFDSLCTPEELSRTDGQYKALADRTYDLERAIRSENCFDLDGFRDRYLQANSFL